MNRLKAAVVAFVKTPGLSPVKTRLAGTLGRQRAEEFFCLAVAALEETLAAVARAIDCAPYWAVAEEEAMTDDRWARFPRIFQGCGGLGDRLNRVFRTLQERHRAVVAIGADSPQLTPHVIMNAVDCLTAFPLKSAYVIGRSPDGGFYLFGTNQPVDKSVWATIPLGEPGAAAALVERLGGSGDCHELPVITDVDRAEDLVRLRDELRKIHAPTLPQQAILDWMAEASLNSSRFGSTGNPVVAP